MTEHDENWISPEVRHYLARMQEDVRRVEAFEAEFMKPRRAARLPRHDEDPE